MNIKVFTTGGTIDKVYFDQLSEFQVGDSKLGDLFNDANVAFEYDIEALMKKDSLDLSDTDRTFIREKVINCSYGHILLTHGTDTMAETAAVLTGITDKIVVLTGSMQPARIKSSDAVFNIGFAVAAIQTLSSGVYIAMNGRVFDANNVKKNKQAQCFELING